METRGLRWGLVLWFVILLTHECRAVSSFSLLSSPLLSLLSLLLSKQTNRSHQRTHIFPSLLFVLLFTVLNITPL